MIALLVFKDLISAIIGGALRATTQCIWEILLVNHI
jgi:hypothetical protein